MAFRRQETPLRPSQARVTLLTLERDGVSDYVMQHPAWMLEPPIITRQTVRKHTAPVARGSGMQGTRLYVQGFGEVSKIYTFVYVPRFEASTIIGDVAGQDRVRQLRRDWLGQWLTAKVGKYEYGPVLLESLEAEEREVNIRGGLVTLEWRIALTLSAESDLALPVWDQAWVAGGCRHHRRHPDRRR